MHSPDKLPHPTTITRRNLIRAMGLVPVACALRQDGSPEYYEGMDTIDPHVQVEVKEVTEPVDLVASGTWNIEGGTIQNGNTLLLEPLDMQILNKRHGNEFVPNPPTNLYGTRLRPTGRFSLGAEILAVQDASVSLRLYSGAPPLRFDDFSFVSGSQLECRLNKDRLVITTQPGIDAEQPHTVPLSPADKHRLDIQYHGDHVRFVVDGDVVAQMPGDIIAGGKDIWLGMHSQHGPARVRNLIAKPLGGDSLRIVDTSTLQITQPSPNGLQTRVGKDELVIGTGAALSHMVADERYAQLVLGSEFGRITPENGMKPQDVQPREGVFTFKEADALVDIALRHGLQVHGHTLIYDKAMPRWMHELPYATAADKQRLRQVLWAHVSQVAGHFKGRVASWDVWNEILSGFNDQVTLSANPFTLGLGEKAIDIAFAAARYADPDAKLYINDYGLETNPQGRGAVMLDLLARLKRRNVPVDGLGIQGHVYELPRDEIKPKILKKLMEDARGMGLEVRITELDITGSHGSLVQAQHYANVARVCLDAPNCTGYTVWGPADKYGSTVGVQNGRLKPGSALLYDEQFRPKPARGAIAKVLRG